MDVIKELFHNETMINKYLQENTLLNKLFYISKLISSMFMFYPFVLILTILYKFEILNVRKLIIIAVSLSILIIVKHIIKRPRPFVLNKDIKNIENNYLDEYSFPSGHSFAAMIIALYIYKKIKNALVFLLPLFVGFSRIQLGVHYLSDVIASFILAFIINTTIK